MQDINLVGRTIDWMSRRQYRGKGRGTLWASEASAEFINEFNEREIVGKCKRAVWYRLKGVEETNPSGPKSQIIFLLGNVIELQLIELWKQMGIWENNSVRWEDRERNLSGEFDVVLREGDRKYGVECKSFYGYHANKQILGHWSGRGENRIFIPGKPKDEHLMQAAIYVDQSRGDLEGFKLFYASRDNNDFAEFNITIPDPENKIIYINGQPERRFTLNDVYARYAMLNQYRDSDTPPSRDYIFKPSDQRVQQLFERGEISDSAYKKHTERKEQVTDWHCSYCPWQTYCHGPLGDSRIESNRQTERPDHIVHGGL